MGMFGVSLPPQQPTGPFSMMDPNAMSPAKPPTMTPQAQAMPQRTGMLGQLVGAFTGQNAGRNLRILGATLRQLGGGPQSNDLDSLLQQLQQQDQLRLQQNWQQTLQQRQQGEWKQEDADRQREQLSKDQINAVIAALPSDQQALARLNPQAYVAGIMRNRFPAPARPRAGSTAPALPDGFDWEN